LKVVETVTEMREAVGASDRPLGLVPTMGYLHEGHLALVRRGRFENTTLAVSIFVNLAQFGPSEDFASYPRDMDSDLAKLHGEGTDLVFAPSLTEIYPDGFEMQVEVGVLGARLEGESRPGHFRSVATVVCKLLSIVRPDRAYFGQKDVQQTKVVTQMVRDLNLGAEVVVVPTVREEDGLALSSRNAYLSPEERTAATVLYRALGVAQRMRDDGVSDAGQVKREMRSLIATEPLASIDYVSIADDRSLLELDRIEDGAVVSLAVRIGRTRLIDNVSL
jgi:pantoate--beta-alanine ligase